jgi:hypothetical protein
MRAVGSAYLFRQTAGSERVGGLQLTIRPKKGAAGTIAATPSDWQTKDLHANANIDRYVEQAIIGIKEVADQETVNLDDVDIELSSFLIHDVDSAPRCYYQAAKSAFRSALEMWSLKDLGEG